MQINPRHLLRSGLALVASVCPAACASTESTSHPPQTAPTAIDIEKSIDEGSAGVSTTRPVRSAPAAFDDTDPDAVRLFYDVLAPYGTWRDDSRLGLIWTPSQESTGADAFVPYATHGRWTVRDGVEAPPEYVWVSELPWGWVTFHYGRWALTGGTPQAIGNTQAGRWAWVAGRRYAGAWVDWRVPEGGPRDGSVIGWGPTPPSFVWRLSPGARTSGYFRPDPREALLTTVSYAAFATPYTYAPARDLFAADLRTKLLQTNEAFAVAYATHPAAAPAPSSLGISQAPLPPAMDRGLQQAWMLATPASATAVGAGPELGPPPRLRTWVAGGARWAFVR